MQSFDCFSLMTSSSHYSAVHGSKLEVVVLNDCFPQDQTFCAKWRVAVFCRPVESAVRCPHSLHFA